MKRKQEIQWRTGKNQAPQSYANRISRNVHFFTVKELFKGFYATRKRKAFPKQKQKKWGMKKIAVRKHIVFVTRTRHTFISCECCGRSCVFRFASWKNDTRIRGLCVPRARADNWSDGGVGYWGKSVPVRVTDDR